MTLTTDGRIRVPADLDAVTDRGAEDPGGLSPAALERIWDSVRHWYAAGMQPAIQLCLRRNGRVVLNRAIGHAWGNGPTDPPDAERIPVTVGTPYCVYSTAKAITTTVVHMLVERGAFSLDDRVCDYLPSYTGHGKERTTIRHVMTHSAGVPFATGPRPDLRRMNDSAYARERLGELKPIHRPGLVHIYHGVTWGPLVREIVSAATGRDIREFLATEILDPLGFRWTNYGVAEADVPLVAPSHVTGKPLPAPVAAAMPSLCAACHSEPACVMASRQPEPIDLSTAAQPSTVHIFFFQPDVGFTRMNSPGFHPSGAQLPGGLDKTGGRNGPLAGTGVFAQKYSAT